MKVRLLILLCIIPVIGLAQSGVVAAGNTATGDGGSTSYSVSQIDFGFWQSADFSFAEGLQQPFEIIPLEVDSAETPSLKVFPNPTTSGVTLRGLSGFYTDYTYELFNFAGQKIRGGKSVLPDTVIPLNGLESGIYLLKVTLSPEDVRTFKIIKHE